MVIFVLLFLGFYHVLAIWKNEQSYQVVCDAVLTQGHSHGHKCQQIREGNFRGLPHYKQINFGGGVIGWVQLPLP